MQTIQLPSSVRIGPYDYDINPEGVEMPGEADQFVGLILRDKLQIVIQHKQAPMQVADTYLHEILHGIWSVCALGASAKEEVAVSALSTGIVNFLRDNPEGLSPLYQAFSLANKAKLERDMNTGGSFS